MSKWVSVNPRFGPKVSCCYALYIGTDLVYIGKTENLKRRLSQHRPKYMQEWHQVIVKYRAAYGCSLDALESALIFRLKPRRNHVGVDPKFVIIPSPMISDSDAMLTCKRCLHTWLRRIATTPHQCPKCKNRHWNDPNAGLM